MIISLTNHKIKFQMYLQSLSFKNEMNITVIKSLYSTIYVGT